MYLNHRIELKSDSRPTANLNLETTHQLHNPGEECATTILICVMKTFSA